MLSNMNARGETALLYAWIKRRSASRLGDPGVLAALSASCKFKQLAKLNLQSRREGVDHLQRGISDTTFNTAHISAIEAAFVSKCFLR